MSYPAYDPDRDTLVTLADHLLGSTALVSIIINHLSDGEFGDLSPQDQIAVHGDVRMAICDFLTELGARRPAAEIATAIAVLEDAITTIAENIFSDDGQCLDCEGRGHIARNRARRH
jgi:hypothetical protein